MNTRELTQILMNIPQVGSERTKKILRFWKGDDPAALIRQIYPFVDVDGKILAEAENKALRQRILAENAGMAVICSEEDYYPRRLNRTGDFPLLLYCLGNREILNARRSAALIGSRRASRAVLSETAAAGELLASLGYVIVSGLALGCDTEAHYAALRGNTPTIAVLPCGPDLCYPRENVPLYNRLVHGGGVLLSEYPPAVPPAPYRFVRRDRIQSGLSDFVVLMDSPEEGGAMHTVKAALVQKRPVFVYDSLSRGNRILISSGRGIPFRNVRELQLLIDDFSVNSHDCHGRGDQILFNYEENNAADDISVSDNCSSGLGSNSADGSFGYETGRYLRQ